MPDPIAEAPALLKDSPEPAAPGAAPASAPKPAPRPAPAAAPRKEEPKTLCPACGAATDPRNDRCSSCFTDVMTFHRAKAQKTREPEAPEKKAAAPKAGPAPSGIAWNAIIGRASVVVLVGAYLLVAPWRGGKVPPGALTDPEFRFSFTPPPEWTADVVHRALRNFDPKLDVGNVQVGLVSDRIVEAAAVRRDDWAIKVGVVREGEDYALENAAKLLGAEAERWKPEKPVLVDGLGAERWTAPSPLSSRSLELLRVPGACRELLIAWIPAATETERRPDFEAFLKSFRVRERPYTPLHLLRYLQDHWYDKEVWGVLAAVVGFLVWLLKREPEDPFAVPKD